MQKLRHICIPFRTRRITRESEGMAAVEFALIAPALLMLVMGTVEVGVISYVASVMESATANTSRLGKTGFTESGISREQTLLNMISDRTGGLVDINLVSIVTTVYPSFDQVGQAEPYVDANANGSYDAGETYDDINGNGERDADMGEAGLGDANDVVVYDISYDWPVVTPVIGYMIGDSGKYEISVRTVVKNEPYDVN